MGVGDDDRQWQRPAGPPEPPPARAPAPPPVYPGPPRMTPPPPEWRPRTLIQVPPPRPLPSQDQPAIDTAEQQARTVTYGVGMITGAILLIVLFVLCGRALLP